MKLIDANKLQKEFQQKLNYCKEWKRRSPENESRADAEMAILEECMITIDCQPLIDAVPVVRCKDCKWYVHSAKSFGYVCYFNGNYRTESEYCSDGEKENGTNNL